MEGKEKRAGVEEGPVIFRKPRVNNGGVVERWRDFSDLEEH